MLREMICRRDVFAPPEVVSYFAPWYFQPISPVSGLSASVVLAGGMICRRVVFAPPEVVSYFAPWYFQTISPVSGLTASSVFAEAMYMSPFAQQSGSVCTGPEYCGIE